MRYAWRAAVTCCMTSLHTSLCCPCRSSFTPPTASLSAIPGTVLLLSPTSQATLLVDSSAVGATLTNDGGATFSADFPPGVACAGAAAAQGSPSATASSSGTGSPTGTPTSSGTATPSSTSSSSASATAAARTCGSIALPGFLTVASPPISFPEDFTIEFWAKMPSLGFAQREDFHFLFSLQPSSWTASSLAFSLPDLPVGVYVIGASAFVSLSLDSYNSVLMGKAFETDQWVHFAVSRDVATVYFFVQGVLAGSAYVPGAIGSSSSVFRVGDDFGNGNSWQGASIADFRVVQGTALYT